MQPEQIRELRKRWGWTQQELADRVGVGVQSVYLWERGKIIPAKPVQILLEVIDRLDLRFLHRWLILGKV